MNATLRARARCLNAAAVAALARDPDAVTLKEFAQAINVPVAAGWAALQRLRRAGLVTLLARGVYRLEPPPHPEVAHALAAYRAALCRHAIPSEKITTMIGAA